MLTRCPYCQTVFRASREQLAAHYGQVRCGICRHPFDAAAHLVKEGEDIFLFSWNEGETQSELPNITPEKTPNTDAVATIKPNFPKEDPAAVLPLLDPIDELLASQEKPYSLRKTHAQNTADEIRQHGLESGLSAARQMREPPDNWSKAPLAGDMPSHTLWPFVLTAVIFAFLLVVQVILHFRSEINYNSPVFADIFRALDIDIPSPREPEYLSIEGSELQTLGEPDIFKLYATIRNKAHYPLAWPYLELTLTDAYNTVLVRKAFQPSEYLTREQASEPFAPGEVSIRLDLGARAIAPTGYNLYLFYP
ncbi:MAG: zinc-ribbon and DUF3426 domain-containing protein [Betaproteobacteria bacterium]|nr:zinc-ribbon and DUF3426 domain-containing protein [Betaproteobacteria bacterium]